MSVDEIDYATNFIRFEDSDYNIWECVKCKLVWELSNDGSLLDNEMYYCPKCGRKIVNCNRVAKSKGSQERNVIY